MKKLLLLTVSALLLTTTSVFAQVGMTDSETGTVKAEIVAPIKVSSTQDLEFGKVIKSAAGGSVTVSTTGGITSSGVTPIGGAHKQATFTIEGEPARQVNISAIADTTVEKGADSMDVTTFQRSLTQATLDGLGLATLSVGATLDVGADQAVGAYTGTFTVTVSY